MSKQEVIGHYKILKSIGEGTFGKVKLAQHTITDHLVAIKVLEKSKIKEQADINRITREIAILKKIQHENVILLYEIIENSTQIFLIMEYAENGELFDYIVQNKRIQEQEASQLIWQVFKGIQYMHNNQVAHRDLKPENLLLDKYKQVKIADFGLSIEYESNSLLKTACGSPCYASPEMVSGYQYDGLKSDIWSCGIVLYAMIVGNLPFEHENQPQLYEKIIEGKFKVTNHMSPLCEDFLNNVLNTDHNQRFNIEQIKQHSFIKQYNDEFMLENQNNTNYINNKVLTQLTKYDLQVETARKFLEQKKHNYVTATYYILLHQQPKQFLKKQKSESEMTLQELIAYKKQQKQFIEKQQQLKERTKTEIHQQDSSGKEEQSSPPAINILQVPSDEKTNKKVSFDQNALLNIMESNKTNSSNNENSKNEKNEENKSTAFRKSGYYDDKIDNLGENSSQEEDNDLSKTIKYSNKMKSNSLYNSNTETDNQKIDNIRLQILQQNDENQKIQKQQLLQQEILISYQKELIEQQIDNEIQHNEKLIQNNLKIINENDKKIEENNNKIKQDLSIDCNQNSSQQILSQSSQNSNQEEIVQVEDIVKTNEVIKNKFDKDKNQDFLFKNNKEGKDLMVEISKTINQDILQSKKYHVQDSPNDKQELQFQLKQPGLIESYQNKLLQQKNLYQQDQKQKSPQKQQKYVNIKSNSLDVNKIEKINFKNKNIDISNDTQIKEIDISQYQKSAKEGILKKNNDNKILKSNFKKLNIQQLQGQYDQYRKDLEKSRQNQQSYSKSNEKSISKINKQFYNKKDLIFNSPKLINTPKLSSPSKKSPSKKFQQTISNITHKKSLTVDRQQTQIDNKQDSKFLTPNKRNTSTYYNNNTSTVNNSSKKQIKEKINFVEQNKIVKNKQNKAKSYHLNNNNKQNYIQQSKHSQNVSVNHNISIKNQSQDKPIKTQNTLNSIKEKSSSKNQNTKTEFSFKLNETSFRAPKTLFRPQLNQTRATEDYIKAKTQTQPTIQNQKHVKNLKNQNYSQKSITNKNQKEFKTQNNNNTQISIKNNKKCQQKVHYGPFNFNSAFYNRPNHLMDKLLEVLNQNKITYEKVNQYQIQLIAIESKIEIMSLQDLKNIQLIQFIPSAINENINICFSTFSLILQQLKQSLQRHQ